MITGPRNKTCVAGVLTKHTHHWPPRLIYIAACLGYGRSGRQFPKAIYAPPVLFCKRCLASTYLQLYTKPPIRLTTTVTNHMSERAAACAVTHQCLQFAALRLQTLLQHVQLLTGMKRLENSNECRMLDCPEPLHPLAFAEKRAQQPLLA